MKHSQAIDLLESFDRAELVASDRQALDLHLSECQACALEAEEIVTFRGFCMQAGGETPDGLDAALESVRQATLSAVRTERPRIFDPVQWIRSLGPMPLALPAAAAVILAVLIVARPQRVSEPVLEAKMAEVPESSPWAAAPVTPQIETAEPVEIAAATAETGTTASDPGRKESTSAKVEGRQHVQTLPAAHRAEPGQVPMFLVVRTETQVRIEWPQNGSPHVVRKAFDASTAQVAGGQVVSGTAWHDPDTISTPGSVTFYLVD